MLPRVLSNRLFRAAIVLGVLGAIPFGVSLTQLRGAVGARGASYTTQATVIAKPSGDRVEVGYLDRHRTPRTATVDGGEDLRAGSSVALVVSERDPSIVWLEHETPPGVAGPALTGLVGIALLLGAVGCGIAALVTVRNRA